MILTDDVMLVVENLKQIHKRLELWRAALKEEGLELE